MTIAVQRGQVRAERTLFLSRDDANALLNDFDLNGLEAEPPVVDTADDMVAKMLAAGKTLPMTDARPPRTPGKKGKALDYTSPAAIKAGRFAAGLLAGGAANATVEKAVPLLPQSTVSRIKTGNLPAGPFRDAVASTWEKTNPHTNPYKAQPASTEALSEEDEFFAGDDDNDNGIGTGHAGEMLNAEEPDDPRDRPVMETREAPPEKTAAELKADPNYRPSPYPNGPQPEQQTSLLPPPPAETSTSKPWG